MTQCPAPQRAGQLEADQRAHAVPEQRERAADIRFQKREEILDNGVQFGQRRFVEAAFAPTRQADASERTYQVLNGDTLWSIAEREYGSGGGEIARSGGVEERHLQQAAIGRIAF